MKTQSLTLTTAEVGLGDKRAWIWGNIGRSYKEMENYDEAIKYFRAAISLNEKHAWSHNHFGHTLLEMKEHIAAKEQFVLAIDIQYSYGWPHIGLAEIYLNYLDQPKDAINEFTVALQFEKRPYGIGRPMFGLARALEAAGRTAEARQRYQEYLDRFPWGEHAQEAQAALERLGER